MIIVAKYKNDSDRKFLGVDTWIEALHLAQDDTRTLESLTLVRDGRVPVDVSMSASCDQGEHDVPERSPL